MSRMIIQQGITDVQKVKNLNVDGHVFNEELSGEREWVFTLD